MRTLSPGKTVGKGLRWLGGSRTRPVPPLFAAYGEPLGLPKAGEEGGVARAYLARLVPVRFQTRRAQKQPA